MRTRSWAFDNALEVASCPHCADGGKVKIVKISKEDSGVFQPLPQGWDKPAYMFLCECGWSLLLTEEQANAHRP
jgi:hypothetical protein